MLVYEQRRGFPAVFRIIFGITGFAVVSAIHAG